MAKKNSFWDLDRVASGLLNLLDPNISNKERLSTKSQKMQNILNREIDISKGVSNGSILEFDMAVRKEAKKTSGKSGKNDDFVDNRKMVSENLGDIFSVYRENYKNKYLEIQDLKFVCRIIPALGEAVRTTLNSMCSSDNISNVLARTINLPSSLNETEKETVMTWIESFEKQEKIKKVLKNQVFKNALITGTQWVYAKPYKEIFNEYEELKKKGLDGKGKPRSEDSIATNRRSHKAAYLNAAEESLHGLDFATESYLDLGDDKYMAMESCVNINQVVESITSVDKDLKSEIDKSKNHISNFFILDSTIPIPVMEAIQAKTSFDKYFNSNMNSTTDQTVNLYSESGYSEKKKSVKMDNYDKESGLYIKVLDYKKLIPYAPMNETVGYFYVHCDKKKLKENLNKNKGLGSLSSLNSEQMRKDKLVDDIVSSITNQILDKFSAKFVADHAEFKKLIADCIITNGFVDQDYKIQFIPAQDIIEFKFNEDEEGQGQSVLIDSLFPAKLLASLLIAKHMNYINNAGDKMMMYLHKGATSMQTGNRAEQIIRNLQTADVNFADYGSSSLLFSKLSRNSNFEVPTGKSGNHLVEFEKWDGQQIDMNTEYEQYLNRMTILGTGVPSTIIEYIDTQDFAKQTETSNIKYAQHITGLQGDATEPMTELYRRAILASNLPENIKQSIATSSEFEVKLPTPKVLSTTNTADSFSTIKSLAEQVADTVMLIDDVNSLDDKTSKMIRSKLISKIMNEEAPHINWELYLNMYKESRIEVEKNIDETNDSGENEEI